MTVEVEFFFDCASPWTYLAFHNIQQLASREGFTIRWRPILVGGVFNAVNPSVYSMWDDPGSPKMRYMVKDLADCARRAGLRIRWRPSVFPVRSMKVMRGCLVAETQGLLVSYATRAFELYWSEDQDISDDRVLAGLCRDVGIEPQQHLAAICVPAVKLQLRQNTEELVRRGGFGSPTMFVAGTDMYFGNDRLDLVVDAVRRGRDPAGSR